MNKKLMLVIFTFFICSNVFALDACTTSELSRLKELANNVEFKRNYKITEDEEEHAIDVLYNIDIINRDKDLKIYYKTAYDTEKIELSSRETNVGDFAPTENVTFYIHAYAENACITKLLKTVT